jgi:hypothetical protein
MLCVVADEPLAEGLQPRTTAGVHAVPGLIAQARSAWVPPELAVEAAVIWHGQSTIRSFRRGKLAALTKQLRQAPARVRCPKARPTMELSRRISAQVCEEHGRSRASATGADITSPDLPGLSSAVHGITRFAPRTIACEEAPVEGSQLGRVLKHGGHSSVLLMQGGPSIKSTRFRIPARCCFQDGGHHCRHPPLRHAVQLIFLGAAETENQFGLYHVGIVSQNAACFPATAHAAPTLANAWSPPRKVQCGAVLLAEPQSSLTQHPSSETERFIPYDC